MDKLSVENYIYKESGIVSFEELTPQEKEKIQENLIRLINQNTNFHAERRE